MDTDVQEADMRGAGASGRLEPASQLLIMKEERSPHRELRVSSTAVGPHTRKLFPLFLPERERVGKGGGPRARECVREALRGGRAWCGTEKEVKPHFLGKSSWLLFSSPRLFPVFTISVGYVQNLTPDKSVETDSNAHVREGL